MNAIGQLLRNNKDSLWQFIRFGIVGGLGVLVNMGGTDRVPEAVPAALGQRGRS